MRSEAERVTSRLVSIFQKTMIACKLQDRKRLLRVSPKESFLCAEFHRIKLNLCNNVKVLWHNVIVNHPDYLPGKIQTFAEPIKMNNHQLP